MNDKYAAIPAAYVLLEREDGKCLFLRRQGTDYMPGKYQMPSGHVEEHEFPSEATIRETKEEVGVDIQSADLELVHISYRVQETRDRIDFFYRTRRWSGEPANMEPHKCDDFHWAALDDLHADTVPVVRAALEHVLAGRMYSEVRIT